MRDERPLLGRGDAGPAFAALRGGGEGEFGREVVGVDGRVDGGVWGGLGAGRDDGGEGREDFLRHGFGRSEEHTSELQSLMRSSYAVFCLKTKKTYRHTRQQEQTTS